MRRPLSRWYAVEIELSLPLSMSLIVMLALRKLLCANASII